MKRILLGLVLAMALSHMAFATVTLKLVSGVTTLQIADGQVAPPGQVDGSGLAGTVLFSGTINGWTVSGATGVTHAPGLVPVGLGQGRSRTLPLKLRAHHPARGSGCAVSS